MEKSTKIIGGVMTAVLFASIFVGSTLALYTTTRTVNNHIISGGMKLKFYLNHYEYDILTEGGSVDLVNNPKKVVDLPVEYGQDNYVEDKGIDLAKYSGEVIQREEIVPLLGGDAKFLVENEGDVAFDLTAKIINFKSYTWNEDEEKYIENDEASILADEQFTFKIKSGEKSATTTKADAAIVIGTIDKESSATFDVSYKFEDLDGMTFDEEEVGDSNRNNRAQDQKITFDIQIEAVQSVINE